MNKTREEIVMMIANNNGMTIAETECAIESAIDMMLTEPEEADEILMSELGIEPDYIDILLIS